MESISGSNYANLTFESKQAVVSLPIVLEGLVGISIVWTCCVYVIYIAFYIIKYLSEKAPNLQTILSRRFLHPIFCNNYWIGGHAHDFAIVD